MKLSDGEKLIVAMLADIHKHLQINGEVDADRVKKSLLSNHMWSLKWDYPGIFDGEEPDQEVIEETGDFLSMWEWIETSYNTLLPHEQADVQAQNHGTAPTFRGFDGNNERHYGVARHMIDVLHSWPGFAGRNINSHTGSVERYRRMYSVAERIKKQKGIAAPVFTKDELIAVLSA